MCHSRLRARSGSCLQFACMYLYYIEGRCRASSGGIHILIFRIISIFGCSSSDFGLFSGAFIRCVCSATEIGQVDTLSRRRMHNQYLIRSLHLHNFRKWNCKIDYMPFEAFPTYTVHTRTTISIILNLRGVGYELVISQNRIIRFM